LKTHKRAGIQTATKENEEKKQSRGSTVVRPSPRPVVSSVRIGPDTSPMMHFELLLTSGFALDLPVLGLLGLLFNLSSLGLASTHIFFLKLGPNHTNLQLELKKVTTERNRRSTCKNHKLMQMNPKFQA